METRTTEEFSQRLGLALEGHPRAPGTVHGRQAWLRQVLKDQAGREVSANTVHKWCRGMARPRPDAMRDISKVLNVDEVWLAFGRKPTSDFSPKEAATASAAALLIASAVELAGGKAFFPGSSDEPVSVQVSLSGETFGVIVSTPRGDGEMRSFFIPEPVGENKVLGVVPAEAPAGHTFAADVIDLTELPRENLGGFSLVRLQSRGEDFTSPGHDSVIRRLSNVRDLV